MWPLGKMLALSKAPEPLLGKESAPILSKAPSSPQVQSACDWGQPWSKDSSQMSLWGFVFPLRREPGASCLHPRRGCVVGQSLLTPQPCPQPWVNSVAPQLCTLRQMTSRPTWASGRGARAALAAPPPAERVTHPCRAFPWLVQWSFANLVA